MAGGDEFPFSACKGRVVDGKSHGQCRLGDLYKFQSFALFRIRNGVADINVFDPRHGHDISGGRSVFFDAIQAFEFVDLVDLYRFPLTGIGGI